MHTLFLLLRRSASFLYDCLLLIAVFFVVTTALVIANDGEDVVHPMFYAGLWIIGGVFFTSFWKHGGQTLGMRAWNLRLVHIEAASDAAAQHNASSAAISTRSSVEVTSKMVWQRYLTGSVLFGITYLWAFIDADGMTAHDRISQTKIISDSNYLRNKP